MRWVVAVVMLLGCLGCSSAGLSLSPPTNQLTKQAEAVVQRAPRRVNLPRELNQTVLSAHYLQPGDVLLVEPVELDADVRFPADQKVLADGTVDLAGYGRVIVAGLTLEAAEGLISQTIQNTDIANKNESEKKDVKPTAVNVRLLEPVHRFYVLGEVASPGSYPFVGNENVLDGILAAGGLTSDANACKVILSRPTPPPSCRVALPICYREITQLGDTTTNYQLQPGDRIYVGSRTLIDDLQFWKANETCDRCCGCQYACPDPSTADWRNPISQILPAPPMLPGNVVRSPSVDGQAAEPGFLEDVKVQPLPTPHASSGSRPSRGELPFDEPITD